MFGFAVAEVEALRSRLRTRERASGVVVVGDVVGVGGVFGVQIRRRKRDDDRRPRGSLASMTVGRMMRMRCSSVGSGCACRCVVDGGGAWWDVRPVFQRLK